MMTAQERVAQLENRLRRAEECVRLNQEALAGAIPSTLEERRDMLAEALEYQAEAETLLLLAREREVLFSKVETASKIMTSANAETRARKPHKPTKSVAKF